MPVRPGTKKDADTIAALKEKYLRYYRQVPIQELAAKYVGRESETIIEWRHKDPKFARLVQEADGDFVSENLRKTKADWKLARIYKKYFAERVEHTGPEGEPLKIELVKFDERESHQTAP